MMNWMENKEKSMNQRKFFYRCKLDHLQKYTLLLEIAPMDMVQNKLR